MVEEALLPYFLVRDEDGQVWRVAGDAQTRIAVEGDALAIDQFYLNSIGANFEVLDFGPLLTPWLDSVRII